MKYMTPELLARFRSTDDTISEPAVAEWDQACHAYNEYLEEVRSRLPRTVRSLLRRPCLHDAHAVVLGLGEDELRFSVFLELDTPREEGIQLTYELVEPTVFLKHPSLSEPGAPLVWLYDEFAVQETVGAEFPTFRHAILFTNGREIQLHFRKLQVTRYKKVFSRIRRPSGVKGVGEGLESLLM